MDKESMSAPKSDAVEGVWYSFTENVLLKAKLEHSHTHMYLHRKVLQKLPKYKKGKKTSLQVASCSYWLWSRSDMQGTPGHELCLAQACRALLEVGSVWGWIISPQSPLKVFTTLVHLFFHHTDKLKVPSVPSGQIKIQTKIIITAYRIQSFMVQGSFT